MNIASFLAHHGLKANPFEGEEARFDPVFAKLLARECTHPDFGKVLGQIQRPSTSVVMGEKGSGKTAIRMMITHRVAAHNRQHTDQRVMLIQYDDLNPVLDRIAQRHRLRVGRRKARKLTEEDLLESTRLEDHQDAILSLGVTRIVDLIAEEQTDPESDGPVPEDLAARVKKMPRQARTDLAALAAVYDKPTGATVTQRWSRLAHRLRIGRAVPVRMIRHLAMALTLIALVGWLVWGLWSQPPLWLGPASGLVTAGALFLWGLWAWRHARVWSLAGEIADETCVVGRDPTELRSLLLRLGKHELDATPWPVAGEDARDRRYGLTGRFVRALDALGYVGVMVLVDRVDEPTLVTGKAQRMRAVVWPMFENKFLQQDRVGLKLLLPIELRHALRRESADFFQEARLDKQNLVEQLTWSGATLYDLCSARLRACQGTDTASPLSLADLFDEDVTREVLVESLAQMHQPRDAFKFLYAVLAEHCANVPEDQARYTIPRPTLETVRRRQAERVNELHRGLAPA